MNRQNERESPTPSRVNDSGKELDGDAVDRFSLIVYGLVIVAMMCQVGWILWIEFL